MATAYQVAYWRTKWLTALDTTCDIERPTDTPDSAGGATRTWAVVGNDVPCRVQPVEARPASTLAGGQVGEVADWDIHLPHDTDVRAPDEIVVGAYRYRVEEATTGRSNRYGVTAHCVRVGGGP